MLAKDILRIVLYGVGLSSLGAVIYLAGPFVAFGDWHPLENHIVRQIAILLLGAAAAGVTGLHFFKRRKNAKEIADGVSGADQAVSDEPVLKERMKDALATLKTASGNKSGYLYDLPGTSSSARPVRERPPRWSIRGSSFRSRAGRRRRRSPGSAGLATVIGGLPRRRC